jgi:xanthine dehydrogenase YagS FAD-binding subunit
MNPLAYARATELDQALAAAAEPDTAFLAGGTELLNWLRLGIAAPARIVDIARLDELNRIEPTPDGGLRIGALVRLNDAALHETVMRDYPVLSQAILKAASAQLRNLATIGGNPLQKTRCPYFRAEEALPCNKRAPGSGCSARHGINDRHAIFGWSDDCVATQPSDPAVALAVLDAVFVTAHAHGGRRLPATEFHTLPDGHPERDNVLRDGELVTAIELFEPARRSAYLKVRERESYEYATGRPRRRWRWTGRPSAASALRWALWRTGPGGSALPKSGWLASARSTAMRCAARSRPPSPRRDRSPTTPTRCPSPGTPRCA